MLTNRNVLKAVVVGAAALAATVAPSAALAEERACRGTLGAVTVDNLRVPQRATCILNGTKVKGMITVQRGATLVASGIRVTGNVQAENAARVVVKRSSRIGGSVQVKQGGGASVTGSRVTGDIQYDANRRLLRATGNRVGGSIQVVGNSGGAAIFRNVVVGNLECKENSPAPSGGSNVVGGSREDQCAGF
jgi:hypothetical protein